MRKSLPTLTLRQLDSYDGNWIHDVAREFATLKHMLMTDAIKMATERFAVIHGRQPRKAEQYRTNSDNRR